MPENRFMYFSEDIMIPLIKMKKPPPEQRGQNYNKNGHNGPFFDKINGIINCIKNQDNSLYLAKSAKVIPSLSQIAKMSFKRGHLSRPFLSNLLLLSNVVGFNPMAIANSGGVILCAFAIFSIASHIFLCVILCSFFVGKTKPPLGVKVAGGWNYCI
jgi:hypothetical protein